MRRRQADFVTRKSLIGKGATKLRAKASLSIDHFFTRHLRSRLTARTAAWRECAAVLKAPRAAHSATQFAPRRTPHATVIRYIFQGGAAVARGIWSDNMWRSDRRASATLAVVALASLAAIGTVAAHDENARERYEHRPSGGQRQAARQPEVRQSRATHPSYSAGVHAAARREASYPRAQPFAHDHREQVGRSMTQRRLSDGSVMRETHLDGSGRASQVSRGLPGGQLRIVRYGNTLSGTVERTIRPGLTSRTFVSGGRVLYTHVYQRQVWYQYGRGFAYEAFVPAVRYPAVYYAWALGAWPRPVTYTWSWQVQPWYPIYGPLFTPYPVYTSPDMWMTDYIIAGSMQRAYQAQSGASEVASPPGVAPAASAPDSSAAAPADQSSDAASAPQPSGAPSAPQSSDTPSAPVGMPPPITPQVKAELNAQIKVQLREQQAAAATPLTLTTGSTPPALRSSHVFFQVVQPLDVPSGAANGYCSLSANDYIKRTGGMSNDDWMIPVVVELSGPADCPQGLETRIGLNDLNAMENEQEAQVMEAIQAASKSMGPNGPPRGPGVHPTLIADGNAAPDPRALDAFRQAQ